MEEVISRKAFYNALMENPSTKMFYRLIRKSKSSKEASSSCIVVDGVKHSDAASQRKCFAQYFEDLAVPKDNDYDNVFLKLRNIRCDKIQSELSNSGKELSFSESDIERSIDKLHYGNLRTSKEYLQNTLRPVSRSLFQLSPSFLIIYWTQRKCMQSLKPES